MGWLALIGAVLLYVSDTGPAEARAVEATEVAEVTEVARPAAVAAIAAMPETVSAPRPVKPARRVTRVEQRVQPFRGTVWPAEEPREIAPVAVAEAKLETPPEPAAAAGESAIEEPQAGADHPAEARKPGRFKRVLGALARPFRGSKPSDNE